MVTIFKPEKAPKASVLMKSDEFLSLGKMKF
jgi:hypothetical protein